jgi:hypothetical protein
VIVVNTTGHGVYHFGGVAVFQTFSKLSE